LGSEGGVDFGASDERADFEDSEERLRPPELA
jgi:hypothetical protein